MTENLDEPRELFGGLTLRELREIRDKFHKLNEALGWVTGETKTEDSKK